MALSILDEPRETKLGRAFHEWIGASAEEFAIACEAVVLVKMRAEPWAAHAPVRPRGLAESLANGVRSAPEVDIVVRYPARQAIVFLSGSCAISTEVFEPAEERFSAFAQVAGFRRPVVHLDIDVRRPIAAPWRRNLIAPDSLKICWLCSGTR